MGAVNVANPHDPLVRLNCICPYFTMFPLSFPYGHLEAAQSGDWVLDPFCGRGTTNFAARLRRLSSVGIDSNPMAVAVSQAKMVSVAPREIVAEATRILSDECVPETIPLGEFWDWGFHPTTLIEVCSLRSGLLRDCASPARAALRALILGVLHGPWREGCPSYLSNQMPRTYATKPTSAVRFWRKHGMRSEYVNALDVIKRRANYTFAGVPPKTDGMVLCADSRKDEPFLQLPHRCFRWVITSPPYFGMRFYRSDQWLRNWFLGGPEEVDYATADQVGARDVKSYLRDLARVWTLVGRVAERGARLIVRFGVIPSLPLDPRAIIVSSVELSESKWRIMQLVGAGRPPRGRRQADQFGCPGEAPEEVDLVAVRA